MKSELELKKELCEIGRRLYAKGMLSSTEGSISVKMNDKEFLCTASGTNKGFMTLDTICKVDAEGNYRGREGLKPTSAIRTHLLIHKNRPEMHAVIHAYPVNALTYANAGVPISQPSSLEVVNALGCIPYVEKGLAQTEEEVNNLTEVISHFDAVLFGDIGVLAFGKTLEDAFNRLEKVELCAGLFANMKKTGICSNLTDSQQREMFLKREKNGFTSKHPANLCVRNKEGKPGCYSNNCSLSTAGNSENELENEIREKILEQLNKDR